MTAWPVAAGGVCGDRAGNRSRS